MMPFRIWVISCLILMFGCSKENALEIVENQVNLDDELIIGVNTQRVFQTEFHEGLTEDEIINRVAELIARFNFNSIRIGGTSSFGSTFDAAYKGFGWSKYIDYPEVAKVHPNDPFVSEPFNYNIIALKTAKKANVSVWIDLHRFMTKDDINEVLRLVDLYDVALAGITRDNEPYIPERQMNMEAAYLDFAQPKFQNFSWPAMASIPASLGDQGNREERQIRCIDLVNAYRSDEESIEIHSYIPQNYMGTPQSWIQTIIQSTRDAYSISNSKIMLGEWSGKNQNEFSDDEIKLIIQGYLDVLEEEKVDSYYQLLGSGRDDTGLYNFIEDKENRGAEVFKNRK